MVPPIDLPWVEQIENRTTALNLELVEPLQIMDLNSMGPPKRMIQDHVASSGTITKSVFTKIWSAFVERFCSQQRILEQLIEKQLKFSVINGSDIGTQLLKFNDLCHKSFTRAANFKLGRGPQERKEQAP